MEWHLTLQTALFIVVVPIFLWLGYRRGWRRELFLLPFILGAVLFLILNIGQALAQFLTQLLLDRPGVSAAPRAVFFISVLCLAGIVAMGYLLGNRLFPKPGTPQDRVLGILPAFISGSVVVYYLTTLIFPGTQQVILGQGFILLDQYHLGYYALGLFIIVAIVIVIRLVTAGGGKKK
jgi:MFS family permease